LPPWRRAGWCFGWRQTLRGVASPTSSLGYRPCCERGLSEPSSAFSHGLTHDWWEGVRLRRANSSRASAPPRPVDCFWRCPLFAWTPLLCLAYAGWAFRAHLADWRRAGFHRGPPVARGLPTLCPRCPSLRNCGGRRVVHCNNSRACDRHRTPARNDRRKLTHDVHAGSCLRSPRGCHAPPQAAHLRLAAEACAFKPDRPKLVAVGAETRRGQGLFARRNMSKVELTGIEPVTS
jgi:hypothetical protein